MSSSALVATVSWSPRLMSPVSSLGCFLHTGLHFNPTRDCVVADALSIKVASGAQGCPVNLAPTCLSLPLMLAPVTLLSGTRLWLLSALVASQAWLWLWGWCVPCVQLRLSSALLLVLSGSHPTPSAVPGHIEALCRAAPSSIAPVISAASRLASRKFA